MHSRQMEAEQIAGRLARQIVFPNLKCGVVINTVLNSSSACLPPLSTTARPLILDQVKGVRFAIVCSRRSRGWNDAVDRR